MNRATSDRWTCWTVALAILLGMASACGGGSDSKGQGQIKEITISPSPILLRDQTTTIPLEVKGLTTTGRRIDLTADPLTVYATTDPAVAGVNPDGTVVPQGEGTASIQVTYDVFNATAEVYSDFTPALAPGDFDLVLPDDSVRPGSRVTVPVLLETGSQSFGSYRAKITFDPQQFELVKVTAGADLKNPTAIRSGTPGEVALLDTYQPSLGLSHTGTVEVARIVLRAVGPTGSASRITGEVLGIWDEAFPAVPIGPETPRAFVTGNRWIVIE